MGQSEHLSYISTCITYDLTKFGNDKSILVEKDVLVVGRNSPKKSFCGENWNFAKSIYSLKMRLSVINNQSCRPSFFFYFSNV